MKVQVRKATGLKVFTYDSGATDDSTIISVIVLSNLYPLQPAMPLQNKGFTGASKK